MNVRKLHLGHINSPRDKVHFSEGDAFVLKLYVQQYKLSISAREKLQSFINKLSKEIEEVSFQDETALNYWNAIENNAEQYVQSLKASMNNLRIDSERSHRRLLNAIAISERALELSKRDELSYANWLASAGRSLLERLQERDLIRNSPKVANKDNLMVSAYFIVDAKNPREVSKHLHSPPELGFSKDWSQASVENTEASNCSV